MWPRTSWSFSSLTRNMVLGRASRISPSISIFSSLGTAYSVVAALGLLDVDSLGALVPGLLLIAHLRPLCERTEAPAANRGVVDEEVTAAIVGRDEAVALFIVEPLDRSGRHM